MMMMKRYSAVDIVSLMPWKWIGVGIHDMSGPDRLGNEKIDFPIYIAFGDRDFFGSEGADKIIRNNKHFKSGRSQLVKVNNCTHLMHLDKPVHIARLLINFVEGDASGRFEEVKHNEVTLPELKDSEKKLRFNSDNIIKFLNTIEGRDKVSKMI